MLWVKIDRKRKVAATSLLRAFGMDSTSEDFGGVSGRQHPPHERLCVGDHSKDAAKNEEED